MSKILEHLAVKMHDSNLSFTNNHKKSTAFNSKSGKKTTVIALLGLQFYVVYC